MTTTLNPAALSAFTGIGTSGAARGTSTRGDIIATTADGADLRNTWNEFQEALALLNAQRDGLAAALSFPTSARAELVAQTTSRDEFEVASEFGVPVGIRTSPDTLRLGYSFEWYDIATRYTWRFLTDADASQVDAIHGMAMAADNRNVWRSIMRALFVPSASTVNEDGTRIFPLWSGDGVTPPDYLARTFTNTHTHYLCSGSAALDGLDVEQVLDTITEHGYGVNPTDQLVLFVNPAEGKQIRRLRAGVALANGAVGSYDFIAGEAAPAYLTDLEIVGTRAPTAYAGLPLIGSIGPAYVCENQLIPAGYILAAATAGSNSAENPVGYRQHVRPELQGLKLLPGNQSGYPLQDATYSHGFGVGVRHRGAASVMQITTATTYVAPVIV